MKRRFLVIQGLAWLCLLLPGAVQAQQTGYLNLIFAQDSAYVFLNDYYRNAQRIVSGTLVELPVGPQKLTFVNDLTYEFELETNLQPGDTVYYEIPRGAPRAFLARSSYAVLNLGATLMVLTDSDSEVFVGGRKVGVGSVALDTLAGTYVVETRHRKAGSTRGEVTVQTSPPRLAVIELHNRPRRGKARRLSVVPGMSQFYKKHTVKGAVFLGAFAAGVGLAALAHRNYLSENDAYTALRQSYPFAETEEESVRLGNEAAAQYDVVLQKWRQRNRLMGGTAGFYLLNLFDAWLTGRRGYRERQPSASYYFSPHATLNGSGVRLSVHF